jgi:methyl-accepting chemotaxis protein
MVNVSTIVELLIVGGAIVMVSSILYTRQLFERLGEHTYQQRWRGLFALMVFFLLGYIAALGVAVSGYDTVFQILVGLVFLFGAAFVFLVVNTGLVTVNDLQDQMEEAQEARQDAEHARKEAETSRAEAIELNNYLQQKADEYAEIMQQCGVGDLTQRMEPDGENDAMDRIASEFNEMIEELEKTTGQLKSFADQVDTAGQVVQSSSESVREASEQVADSIQRISDDAYDQKERLQGISETMDKLVDDLERVDNENPEIDLSESLDRIDSIVEQVNDVVELSEETLAESENVAGAAEEQAAELNEVSQRAEDLTRYAEPLREVLDRFETEAEHEFYFPTGPGSEESDTSASGDE